VRVNDNDSGYRTGAPFSLGSNERSMEIKFTAPYYLNAMKVQYRYRMEGFDNNWKHIGTNNSVLFTSLPSGNFRFRVAGSIDGINWYESGERVSFSIAPYFWKTWWFVLLIQAIVASVIYFLYKYRLNKQLAMERFRTQIARDLHDDIGSTLSSINILARSGLTSSDTEPRGQQEVLLQKIQARTQKMLDAMDDLIWNTKPGNESMETLSVRMREYAAEVLEPLGISFTLVCPAAVNTLRPGMSQRKNIYLVFKEAVNNLAKYSNSATASAVFVKHPGVLEMRIRDEGGGFAEAVARKGNGLHNMRARAADLQGSIEVISQPGSGTEIRLFIPL
jgi:two-component sensor histidine kinase